MRIPRSTLRSRALAATLAMIAVGATACGSDNGASTQRYCDSVRDNAVQLDTPAIATADDIASTLALYRRVAGVAPLSVEVEWATLVLNLETASTVVTSDQASMQHTADTARASQRAAEKVQTYTHEVCGVDLGTPPTTVVVTAPPTTGTGG